MFTIKHFTLVYRLNLRIKPCKCFVLQTLVTFVRINYELQKLYIYNRKLNLFKCSNLERKQFIYKQLFCKDRNLLHTVL